MNPCVRSRESGFEILTSIWMSIFCADYHALEMGLHCGRELCVDLVWEYVSARNHCGRWICVDHRSLDCALACDGRDSLERESHAGCFYRCNDGGAEIEKENGWAIDGFCELERMNRTHACCIGQGFGGEEENVSQSHDHDVRLVLSHGRTVPGVLFPRLLARGFALDLSDGEMLRLLFPPQSGTSASIMICRVT